MANLRCISKPVMRRRAYWMYTCLIYVPFFCAWRITVKDINGCWRKIAHRQAEQAAPLRSSGPLGVVGAVKVHSTSTRALAHGPQGCWPSHPLVYGKKSQTPAQALVKIDLRFSSNGIAHKWTLWPPYPWLSTSSLRGSALSAHS